MVPWKAERQAWMLCCVFVALLFSLHGFLYSEMDVPTAKKQRWVSFSRKQYAWELCKHVSGYTYFVVKTVVSYIEVSLSGVDLTQHVCWLLCRHLLRLSVHMVNNRFCFCCVFLAAPAWHCAFSSPANI